MLWGGVGVPGGVSGVWCVCAGFQGCVQGQRRQPTIEQPIGAVVLVFSSGACVLLEHPGAVRRRVSVLVGVRTGWLVVEPVRGTQHRQSHSRIRVPVELVPVAQLVLHRRGCAAPGLALVAARHAPTVEPR